MSRLQCVGTSSKVPSKDAEALQPGIPPSRVAPVNKSLQSKKQPQKPKLSRQLEGQQPSVSVITERRRDKGNVDRSIVDPEPVSKTQQAQLENNCTKPEVMPRPSRSETNAGLQALSPADTSMHRLEKLPRHAAPVGAVFTEEKSESADGVQTLPEAVVQVPQYFGVPESRTGLSTSKAESGDEEEREEEDADRDGFRAPIELLAEFLKAVMERKYTLAKKLCQMILIYEPENPEAKHFLPLIEERLLTDEAQENSSGNDTSDNDDDDDDDDDDNDDDDDDDDEETSSSNNDDDDTDTGTDSDGENSFSSSSDRDEKDISLS